MRAVVLLCVVLGCGDDKHLTTIDAPTPDTPPDAAPDATQSGALRGTFALAYYWIDAEADFPGTPDTPLYDPACAVLATVTSAFASDLRLAGTGRLADGRTLNVAGSCTCGSSTTCYGVLPPQYPWGIGAYSRALAPFRSLAVDRTVIPIGTALWIEELAGVALPDGAGTHDGCVIADDVAGTIAGMQLAWFVGLRTYSVALDGALQLTTVTVYDAGMKCP